jgi:hypothetical protein
MTVFPEETRTMDLKVRDRLLSRLPIIAAAFLITLLGLLPGLARDAEIWRGLQSADKTADGQHLSKREPLRALAASERKEAGGAYLAGADGVLNAHPLASVFPDHLPAVAPQIAHAPALFSFWPGSLPRAPPRQA